MRGEQDKASVFFIGNATTLIKCNGFTILTDPNFLHRGQRAYLGYGLSAKRRTDPALTVDQLPPLDAVVLSHMHGDHWDRVARDGLDKATPIVTTPQAAGKLRRQGYTDVAALHTWHSNELTNEYGSLRVTALPARHGPGAADFLMPQTMGSLLEFSDPGGHVLMRMLISGDTLMAGELAEIPRRFPDIDVGIVHLGGTKLLGMLMVTMDGRQGAQWVDLIRPRVVVPVHYDDYTVFSSPLSDFREKVEQAGHGARVTYLDRGQSCELQLIRR
ncbi:MBL fold metallo-hydrolase [Nonomuraea jiangxiensis]|uniref:L-ascorbate metabolism protein UlaG, beta-lactamase superfamily n=1 Tax=Nonomuraea jiangxiensis TaxID=633440 RepID=A0A1G9IY39_9ACTN|nr:MBL fold metallo-hydrolase [Nonomuraea jiangxiensis]SDL30001.1 L-ascorbate metabolism protein UlaG, beta-lactamase superfamily [Nonomuraea jiangxiensis]